VTSRDCVRDRLRTARRRPWDIGGRHRSEEVEANARARLLFHPAGLLFVHPVGLVYGAWAAPVRLAHILVARLPLVRNRASWLSDAGSQLCVTLIEAAWTAGRLLAAARVMRSGGPCKEAARRLSVTLRVRGWAFGVPSCCVPMREG